MSEKLRESLSAVMDGEADDFELRRVLDELGRDEALRAEWMRLHEARAILRNEHHQASPDLADRVWDAMSGEMSGEEAPEPTVQEVAAQATTGSRNRLGRMTGFGVAAAMALAVIVGTNVFQSDGLDGSGPEVASVDAIDGKLEGPVVRLTNDVSAEDLRRARAYMVYHVQHNAMNQPGVSSFAKMVAMGESSQEMPEQQADEEADKAAETD